MPMFVGCFIVRSWRSVSCLTGLKSLPSSKPISISAWQCLGNSALLGALVGKKGRLLKLSQVASLGREVELQVLG